MTHEQRRGWTETVRDYQTLCKMWDLMHDYSVCASWWYDVPIDQVSPQQRAQMKIMLFGHVYGSGINSFISLTKH